MTANTNRDLEPVLGRLLVLLTYVSVGLLTIGVVMMLAQGISPLATAPPFDPGTIVPDILALRPTGFLWLGLLAVLATPIARVVIAGVGFARDRQWAMVLVAIGTLIVIAAGVASAVLTEV